MTKAIGNKIFTKTSNGENNEQKSTRNTTNKISGSQKNWRIIISPLPYKKGPQFMVTNDHSKNRKSSGQDRTQKADIRHGSAEEIDGKALVAPK